MNTHIPFSFGEMITGGWNIFKKNWKFILLAGIVTIIINIALTLLRNTVRGSGGVIEVIVTLFTVFVSILIAIGWAKVSLELVRQNTSDWDTFKSTSKVWVKYIKAYLWYLLYIVGYSIAASIVFAILATIGYFTDINALTIIGVVLGVTAFVLVTIYFSIRYQFLIFTILDHGELSAKEIFKKSGMITKGSLLELFGFEIVLGFMNLLAIIPLGLGLIITIPVTKLAQTKAYQYLKDHQN